MSGQAVVIVDMQKDFVEGGALGVSGGCALVPRINQYVKDGGFDLVVASRDYHDPGQDNGGHFAEKPDFVDTWPVHCVAGTPGADYADGLDLKLIDVHVVKGMGEPAYSACEGVVDGSGERLIDLLKTQGITKAAVVGIATDYCVKATAMDLKNAGFDVMVVTDLVAGVAPITARAALDELRTAGVRLAQGNEVK